MVYSNALEMLKQNCKHKTKVHILYDAAESLHQNIVFLPVYMTCINNTRQIFNYITSKRYYNYNTAYRL